MLHSKLKLNKTMPAALSTPGGHMPPNANISGTGHQQQNVMPPSTDDCGIRDVWKYNMEEEFRTIRQIVQKYHYVAMDTEFPGVVARPVGEFRSTSDYHYQLLRCNVDLLRIIQLGLTFMDEDGKTPPGYSTWQFNFKFNLSEDMYAQDSIDLLQNSGIQFKKHEEDGIDPIEFAELLMSSGIVLMDNIKWLCFHSGYDFGYLLKMLTDQNLPSDETEFFELIRIYFPHIYDVKYLMKSCKTLKGGLQEVADQLELRRVGPQHQAGSDALLTGMAFFKMREVRINVDLELSSFELFMEHAILWKHKSNAAIEATIKGSDRVKIVESEMGSLVFSAEYSNCVSEESFSFVSAASYFIDDDDEENWSLSEIVFDDNISGSDVTVLMEFDENVVKDSLVETGQSYNSESTSLSGKTEYKSCNSESDSIEKQ